MSSSYEKGKPRHGLKSSGSGGSSLVGHHRKPLERSSTSGSSGGNNGPHQTSNSSNLSNTPNQSTSPPSTSSSSSSSSSSTSSSTSTSTSTPQTSTTLSSSQLSIPASLFEEGLWKNSRFAHSLTSLVGVPVIVETNSEGTYEGILWTISRFLDVVLLQSHLVNKSNPQEIKQETLEDKRTFHAKDIVRLYALDVDLEYATKKTFQTDYQISSGKTNGPLRELEEWKPEEGEGEELEGGLESSNNGWKPEEMFAKNEQNYGVKSTYKDNLEGYTCQLSLEGRDSLEYKQREAKATEIARQIEQNSSSSAAVELENGEGDNEEEAFSAVARTSSPHHSRVSSYSRSSNNEDVSGGGSTGVASSSGNKYIPPSRRGPKNMSSSGPRNSHNDRDNDNDNYNNHNHHMSSNNSSSGHHSNHHHNHSNHHHHHSHHHYTSGYKGGSSSHADSDRQSHNHQSQNTPSQQQHRSTNYNNSNHHRNDGKPPRISSKSLNNSNNSSSSISSSNSSSTGNHNPAAASPAQTPPVNNNNNNNSLKSKQEESSSSSTSKKKDSPVLTPSPADGPDKAEEPLAAAELIKRGSSPESNNPRVHFSDQSNSASPTSTPASTAAVAANTPPLTTTTTSTPSSTSSSSSTKKLNPNAKEFVLNPNAKMFTSNIPPPPMSTTPSRPQTPATPVGAPFTTQPFIQGYHVPTSNQQTRNRAQREYPRPELTSPIQVAGGGPTPLVPVSYPHPFQGQTATPPHQHSVMRMGGVLPQNITLAGAETLSLGGAAQQQAHWTPNNQAPQQGGQPLTATPPAPSHTPSPGQQVFFPLAAMTQQQQHSQQQQGNNQQQQVNNSLAYASHHHHHHPSSTFAAAASPGSGHYHPPNLLTLPHTAVLSGHPPMIHPPMMPSQQGHVHGGLSLSYITPPTAVPGHQNHLMHSHIARWGDYVDQDQPKYYEGYTHQPFTTHHHLHHHPHSHHHHPVDTFSKNDETTFGSDTQLPHIQQQQYAATAAATAAGSALTSFY